MVSVRKIGQALEIAFVVFAAVLFFGALKEQDAIHAIEARLDEGRLGLWRAAIYLSAAIALASLAGIAWLRDSFLIAVPVIALISSVSFGQRVWRLKKTDHGRLARE